MKNKALKALLGLSIAIILPTGNIYSFESSNWFNWTRNTLACVGAVSILYKLYSLNIKRNNAQPPVVAQQPPAVNNAQLPVVINPAPEGIPADSAPQVNQPALANPAGINAPAHPAVEGVFVYKKNNNKAYIVVDSQILFKSNSVEIDTSIQNNNARITLTGVNSNSYSQSSSFSSGGSQSQSIRFG